MLKYLKLLDWEARWLAAVGGETVSPVSEWLNEGNWAFCAPFEIFPLAFFHLQNLGTRESTPWRRSESWKIILALTQSQSLDSEIITFKWGQAPLGQLKLSGWNRFLSPWKLLNYSWTQKRPIKWAQVWPLASNGYYLTAMVLVWLI